MSVGDDLYLLLHSLTKSERSKVRITLETARGKGYGLIMFNTLNAQPVFDEDSLREVFSGQTLDAYGHLKKWLFEKVLNTVVNGETEGTDLFLSQKIAQIHFLIRKNLPSKATQMFLKAEKLAREREALRRQMDLITCRKNIATLQLEGEKLKNEMEVLSIQRKRLKEQLSNLLDYEDLWDSILSLPRGSKESLQQHINRIKSNPLVKKPMFLSVKANILYLRIHQWITKMSGDYNQSLNYAKELVLLIENSPDLLKDSEILTQYCYYIISWGMLLCEIDRSEEAGIVLQKLEKLGKTIPGPYRHLVWGKHHTLQLRMLGVQSNFREMKKLISKIEKEFPRFETISPRDRIVLCYKTGECLIILGEHRRALAWLDRLIQTKTVAGNDLVAAGKILKLVCYYSMESMDNLARELKLDKRRIKINKYSDRFDFILKFFKKVMRSDLWQRKKLERELEHEIRTGKTPPFANQYFDWGTWILSIMQKKRMRDLKINQ